MMISKTLELKSRAKENVQKLKLGLFLTPYGQRIKNFVPKILFRIEKDQYIIKTAHDGEDLEKVLKLRHEVFYTELLNKKLLTGLDVDRFDLICDHLIIEDRVTGEFMGTYRLNSSLYSHDFYSETEFEMQAIKNLPGIKLELGRACIHKDHRNGLTIALLWSGLSEYMKRTNTQYLFGCSSIKTTEIKEIASIEKYLKTHYYSSEQVRVTPKKKFKVKNLAEQIESLETYEQKEARKMIPSLLKSYLKTGAVVCGEPALDKSFQCIDCLTLLDVSLMNKTVEKKFQVC